MGHRLPCALSCIELVILWCRVLNKADGSQVKVPLKHTFNEQQIEWFKAGSALNRMKQVRLVLVSVRARLCSKLGSSTPLEPLLVHARRHTACGHDTRALFIVN